jgi:hypothetical protein
MADFYQMKALYASCGQLIRRNLVKKEQARMLGWAGQAKWLELKKKAPEFAFWILKEFADRKGNSNDQRILYIPLPPTNGGQKCYYCEND